MKTLTVRLPDALVAEISTESKKRGLSMSDVVRERLQRRGSNRNSASRLHAIADLVGSVTGLPPDLSSSKKKYLRKTGYGRKRPR
jgi:Arc/MetJ-type ribon-helix-helix transcriptional regulator